MASLKDLRTRIKSVTATERITAAMKMVAAAKLTRAQERVAAARPYAERMEFTIAALAAAEAPGSKTPLLCGHEGKEPTLIVLVTSDRGLCGGFNGNLVRAARREITAIQSEGREVRLMTIGRKGGSLLNREYGERILNRFDELSKPIPTFEAAETVRDRLASHFEAGEFGRAILIFGRFQSALVQEPARLKLIPFETDQEVSTLVGKVATPYGYEPDSGGLLRDLAPRNLAIQIYHAMLESFASEQGARMTAMDNATRNAGDLIQRLGLLYNRSRQAQITKELIEIISGAEAA